MNFNLNGSSVFKFLGVLAAIGFLWFTFVAPEATNAAVKSNYCLIGLLGCFALYFYQKSTDESKFSQDDAVWRRIDEVERELSNHIRDEVRDLNSRIDGVNSGSNCYTTCNKKR